MWCVPCAGGMQSSAFLSLFPPGAATPVPLLRQRVAARPPWQLYALQKWCCPILCVVVGHVLRGGGKVGVGSGAAVGRRCCVKRGGWGRQKVTCVGWGRAGRGGSVVWGGVGAAIRACVRVFIRSNAVRAEPNRRQQKVVRV